MWERYGEPSFEFYKTFGFSSIISSHESIMTRSTTNDNARKADTFHCAGDLHAMCRFLSKHVSHVIQAHLPHALASEVIHQSGRCHSLPRARWTLDQRQWPLQNSLDRSKLRVIELGQARRRESRWKINSQNLRLHLVSEQP